MLSSAGWVIQEDRYPLQIFWLVYIFRYLNISKNYKSQARDVVILSAGHYCPALYAILAEKIL